MAEINMNLQKAIDDHLKRLYERYKSNTKVFTAALVGHISLSIVFIISILFPFLFLQIDARETNSELERLSQAISLQEQRAAVYRQAMTGLKKVYEAVENTPKPLESYIQALEKEAAGGPAAPMPDGLKTAAGILRFECGQRPLDGMPHPTVHGCAGFSVPGHPGQ